MKQKEIKHNGPQRRERGQSFVELALSFVLLMTLLAGVVDIGRAFFAVIALREAAEEGAVYGSIEPTDTSGIIQRAIKSSDTPVDLENDPSVNVSVTVSAGACAGGVVQVTVTYDLPVAMPFIGAIIGSDTYHLGATMYNTILRPPC